MKSKSLQHSLVQTQCVIPEDIHTSPTEGIFFSTPLEIPIKLHASLLIFAEPLTPQEIPIPDVGGVWKFSGTAHYLKELFTQKSQKVHKI